MQRSPAEALVLVLALVRGAYAQTSEAACKAGFDWTFNSRQQSPCTVAAYLDSACQDPTLANIPALSPGAQYILPQAVANDCQCNSVFYSILSACALCQEEPYLSWTGWSTNCSRTFVEQFPNPIPPGTAVPAWAYLDLPSGNWSSTRAETFKAGNTTELTAPTTSSSSSDAPSSTSASVALETPSAIPSPTTAAASAAPHKHTHIGAIVGGVVGGAAGLVLVVLGALFWRRHRQAQRRPPSAAFARTAPLEISPYTPEPHEKGFSPSSLTAPYSAGTVRMHYNPVADDVVSVPETRVGDSVYAQSLRGSAIFHAQNGYQPAGITYTGVSEV